MAKEKKVDPKRVVTPVGRVSFPKVYKAEAFEDQAPKFSCTLLFKKNTDLTPLKKALHAAKVELWGEDKNDWPKGLTSPIKDGDEKEDLDGYEGMYYLTAANKLKPDVVDRALEPIAEESDEFYAGCMARMAIRAYAWEFKNKKGHVMKRGVSFSLENVQKIGEGERFSGRQKANEVFDRIEENDSDSDEFGDDDDSGF